MTEHEATSPEQPPAQTEVEQLKNTVTTLLTIVNRVREAVGTDVPAPADGERTAARRANIWAQLDRVGSGLTLGASEAELLRNQVEAELRLSDQAHQRWQQAEAAIDQARRLCELTIRSSSFVHAVRQASDTLRLLDSRRRLPGTVTRPGDPS
ncbi:hypothetical protein [Streptomyces sp. PD-S100-1]|uniref:hypothetical protein n=1 Tax=Streptomyces sp. PD-S100-1 TaxID=3394351 RepID=UPI0039BCCA02